MVRAWYYDNSDEDQRLPHMLKEGEFLDLEQVKSQSGVLYFKIDADNYESEGKLKKICEDRGYTYQDLIEIDPEKLPNYNEKIKSFFTEHLHSDEEIRFILDGTGYFDVRDKSDRWIRIEVGKGDLIILPAGIYHRFTLDSKNYIKANRLFVGEPVWTPINRPADQHPARTQYLTSIGVN